MGPRPAPGGSTPAVRRGRRGRQNGPMSSSPLPSGETDLGALIADWIDWHQAGEVLGVSPNRVRRLVAEHQLAAAVPAEGVGIRLPAEQFQDGEIVKGLSGLLMLLHDNGFDDREALAWLFTADETLPGRPIDALRENRGSEVKRRAQAMA